MIVDTSDQLQGELIIEVYRMLAEDYYGVIVCNENDAISIVDYLKSWLPNLNYNEQTRTFKYKNGSRIRVLCLPESPIIPNRDGGQYCWAEQYFCGMCLTSIILVGDYRPQGATWRESEYTLPYIRSRLRSACQHRPRMVIL